MRGCEPHALVEWTFGILDDCASRCLFRRRTTVARYGRRSACFTRVGHCLCCLISRWTGDLMLYCVCSTVGRSCETRGSASRSTTLVDRSQTPVLATQHQRMFSTHPRVSLSTQDTAHRVPIESVGHDYRDNARGPWIVVGRITHPHTGRGEVVELCAVGWQHDLQHARWSTHAWPRAPSSATKPMPTSD
jgi:hypothetical protein